MPNKPRVVFVFDEAEVHVFRSLGQAEAWMEAIDVDGGEYIAALTDTGRVIRMGTKHERVVLEMTDDVDVVSLHRLLRKHGRLVGQPGIELDPVDFANWYWELEWQSRWPRWPRWLDERLHGRGPEQA